MSTSAIIMLIVIIVVIFGGAGVLMKMNLSSGKKETMEEPEDKACTEN